MGRHGEGPKRTDGRMWTQGGATLPRRTGETRRGSERIGNDPLNNPQPEIAAISPKSRAHGAMVASYSLQTCGALIAPCRLSSFITAAGAACGASACARLTRVLEQLRELALFDLGGGNHRLGAAVDVELLQDRRNVRLDGRFGNRKLIGDLLVHQPVRKHHQH